ncbi:MAG: M23 family metallopeptidase [Bacteroidales bacterium]|nr:M23 family metallopeptidase [Bacteroidales bacterium]
MAREKADNKKAWIAKLRNKYRLVIMNEDTYEEKVSFKLSRLNVLIAVGSTIIILIVLTIFVIAFTPLREYIPGYTDVSLQRKVYELTQKADSLEREFQQNNVYLENVKRILEGKEPEEDSLSIRADMNYESKDISYNRSVEDSLLRTEYEREVQYSLYYPEIGESETQSSPLSNMLFFNPLEGIITTKFDLVSKHFGVDIVAPDNEAVKATLDGTVIFSNWTVSTGYVIGIQHRGNFLSIYKHNSVLLKSEGSIVKAGEPIAIVGASGELSTGPHLHFELWYKGAPVDPNEYIAF